VVIPSDSAPDAIRDVIADISSGASQVDKIKLAGDVETYGVSIPENTTLTLSSCIDLGRCPIADTLRSE
jgi:hypothetical protein